MAGTRHGGTESDIPVGSTCADFIVADLVSAPQLCLDTCGQVGTKAAAGLQRVEGLSLGATLGLLAIAAACLTIAHGWTVAAWLFNLWR